MARRLRHRAWWSFLFLPGVFLCVQTSVLAQWQPVATGIEYQEFVLPAPNHVYVARMDRTVGNAFIDSMIGLGQLVSGTETVTGMAARYDDTVCYWGQTWGTRRDIVVAVNGDFYSAGVPVGGQIISGWYAKRFTSFTGGSGFAWQLDRDIFVGGCVNHVASKQKLAFPATGDDMNINGINVPRIADGLVVYTPQYAGLTPGIIGGNIGVTVIVELARPAMILPAPSYAAGTVLEIRDPGVNTPIQFDHVVLSAHGTAQTKLLNNISAGSEVRLSQEIRHYEADCSTTRPYDWTKTYASIGGSFHFLINGVVQSFTDPGATARHPRTAVAFNGDYVFFIVVDGRSAQSVGMSMTELGTFCLGTLQADEGINQDGGGSSAMWVNGQIMNVPSDGAERPVANGLMMALAVPMEKSVRFAADLHVRTRQAVTTRLGPGSNFALRKYLAAEEAGLLLAHDLNGVEASGENWWKCQFGAEIGWLTEAVLAKGSTPGDLDGNGDVTAADLTVLVECLSGPENSALPPGCDAFAFDDADLDDDNDVDLHDSAKWALWAQATP